MAIVGADSNLGKIKMQVSSVCLESETIEFQAVGLGFAYKDSYEFISAGLYDYSKGEVGNGRGVATSRDGETQVDFYDIDFGWFRFEQ